MKNSHFISFFVIGTFLFTSIVSCTSKEKSALELIGTYQGVLPCSDCEGVHHTLSLLEHQTFSLKKTYLGKEEKHTTRHQGTYTIKNKRIILNMVESPMHLLMEANHLLPIDQQDKNGTKSDEKHLLKRQ